MRDLHVANHKPHARRIPRDPVTLAFAYDLNLTDMIELSQIMDDDEWEAYCCDWAARPHASEHK